MTARLAIPVHYVSMEHWPSLMVSLSNHEAAEGSLPRPSSFDKLRMKGSAHLNLA
jgi:hypothetical protein